jgi:hypothetical protein
VRNPALFHDREDFNTPGSRRESFAIMETPVHATATRADAPKTKPLVRKAGARQRLVLGERQVTFTWMV